MSLDLFVVRGAPLTWAEVLRACDTLGQENDGLAFWAMSDDAQGSTAYFWKVARATLAWVSPEPEDVQQEDPPELAKPYVVVSSRSGAWPWIEWTALALAERLGARIYDPQNGEMLGAVEAEHDLAALRRLHDDYLREVEPSLVSSHWALGVGEPTSAGLRAHVDVIDAVAREVLGVDSPIAIGSDEQVNAWHTYTVGGAKVTVSSDMGSIYDPSPKRTLHVEGPASEPRVRAFADALARRLGIRFRSVEEYR